jgi:CRP/FNR family cyclic AMP-dependent transcriptional regulator
MSMGTSGPWPERSLLAQLSEAERHELLSGGTSVVFGRGEFLVRQGEPGQELFLVVSGCAKVTLTADNGTDMILALRGRGELVGEFAVIDGMPRSASVIALNSMSTVRVSQTRFAAFCSQHPVGARIIMQSLTNKIRQTTDFPVAGRALNSRVRVARLLGNVASAYGVRQPDGTVVLPALTQTDLAALASVATSTIERVLREFRQEGILVSRYRQSVILDIPALLRQAAGPQELAK